MKNGLFLLIVTAFFICISSLIAAEENPCPADKIAFPIGANRVACLGLIVNQQAPPHVLKNTVSAAAASEKKCHIEHNTNRNWRRYVCFNKIYKNHYQGAKFQACRRGAPKEGSKLICSLTAKPYRGTLEVTVDAKNNIVDCTTLFSKVPDSNYCGGTDKDNDSQFSELIVMSPESAKFTCCE